MQDYSGGKPLGLDRENHQWRRESLPWRAAPRHGVKKPPWPHRLAARAEGARGQLGSWLARNRPICPVPHYMCLGVTIPSQWTTSKGLIHQPDIVSPASLGAWYPTSLGRWYLSRYLLGGHLGQLGTEESPAIHPRTISSDASSSIYSMPGKGTTEVHLAVTCTINHRQCSAVCASDGMGVSC